MKKIMRKHRLLLPLFLMFSLLHSASCNDQQSKVFIVYLGEHSGESTAEQIQNHHHSFLLSIKESDETARKSLHYSYKNSINGFAATLSEQEAAKISQMEGVVSVFPSEGKSSLHTTRSWDFIESLEGFNGSDKGFFAENVSYGDDIIIGMLDSGIWPESKSFSDEGMGPVSKGWKGVCEEGEAFNSSNCNRKIIGARFYLKGYESHYGKLNTSYAYRSPRDHDGHGTHTASIAAGRPVSASFLGNFAGGTARGGAPLARLAIYKVCWPIPGPNPNLESTCFDADMIAAIDDAIADGVDILSISIGARKKPPGYAADPIALGTLHALKRGVVSICSAGNSGPAAATVVNLAPWVITVAASSIDRMFKAAVVLGNGSGIVGQSLTPYNEKMMKTYPLVYAGDVELPNTQTISGQCLPNSLAREKVEGKVVLCLTGAGYWAAKSMEVKRAGGAAMILGDGEAKDINFPLVAYAFPTSAVTGDQAILIRDYIASDVNPTVRFGRPRNVVEPTAAPAMALFSSRGPNTVEPNILKPDITAPGLLILAAWSEASSPTKFADDHRVVKYNLYSGTSMACPHASATAALLKSVHPQWTSAAIRSAIITTATVHNDIGQPMFDEAGGLDAGPMAFGSGHIRPNHAVNPGLIYDATYADYLLFMCASTGMEIDPSFPCPNRPPSSSSSSSSDLNHPSVAVTIPSNGSRTTIAINRIVTNVGQQPARYEVSIVQPLGFSVEVRPKILQFKMQGEKKMFQVIISAKSTVGISQKPFVSGSFTWYDGIHRVRSPVVVNVA